MMVAQYVCYYYGYSLCSDTILSDMFYYTIFKLQAPPAWVSHVWTIRLQKNQILVSTPIAPSSIFVQFHHGPTEHANHFISMIICSPWYVVKISYKSCYHLELLVCIVLPCWSIDLIPWSSVSSVIIIMMFWKNPHREWSTPLMVSTHSLTHTLTTLFPLWLPLYQVILWCVFVLRVMFGDWGAFAGRC
jgi:hypothetical protein